MNDHPEPLRVSNLQYAYPDSNWNLEIGQFSLRQGEIVAIIGPNGSGKSTFMRLASGVQRYTKGIVEVEGQDIRRMDRRNIAKIIGYLPQTTPYEFDHRVINVVALGRYAHLTLGGFMQDYDMEIIEDCLKQTDTAQFRSRRLSQLSGGERQRVLLASVLAQEPSILLLDEPINSLDLHHQVRFFEILTNLVKDGMAVAVVLHDLNFASLYCGRVVLMNEGRIVHEGSPDQVIRAGIIESVYGNEIVLARHPQNDRPVVFPRMEEKQ